MLPFMENRDCGKGCKVLIIVFSSSIDIDRSYSLQLMSKASVVFRIEEVDISISFILSVGPGGECYFESDPGM